MKIVEDPVSRSHALHRSSASVGDSARFVLSQVVGRLACWSLEVRRTDQLSKCLETGWSSEIGLVSRATLASVWTTGWRGRLQRAANRHRRAAHCITSADAGAADNKGHARTRARARATLEAQQASVAADLLGTAAVGPGFC